MINQGRAPIRLGLIGYGEVGHGFATGLIKAGLRSVSAYQRAADRPTIQARAKASGVRLVPSLAALAEASDLIIAITQVADSIEAARAIAPSLGARHCYVDLASASPKVKEAVSDLLTPRGVLVADGALEGSPLEYEHRIPIIVSGPGARHFERIMAPWGMRIKVVSDQLGRASAIKCLRHIVMKGQIAVLIESLVAARRYGIADELFATLTEWFASLPFDQQASRIVRSTAVHAARRADEVGMSAEILRDLGMDPVMSSATETVLKRVAALGLRESLGGEVPPTLEGALALLDGYTEKGKQG